MQLGYNNAVLCNILTYTKMEHCFCEWPINHYSNKHTAKSVVVLAVYPLEVSVGVVWDCYRIYVIYLRNCDNLRIQCFTIHIRHIQIDCCFSSLPKYAHCRWVLVTVSTCYMWTTETTWESSVKPYLLDAYQPGVLIVNAWLSLNYLICEASTLSDSRQLMTN